MLLLAMGVIFLLAVLGFIVLTAGRPAASPALPNPNGYDDFLRAAALMTVVGTPSTLGHDALQALISTNAETLRMLRLGLGRNCSVHTDSVMTNIGGQGTALVASRHLAQLLAEEGRLAEMEGRFSDAAQSYVDMIHFGNEISRGGFLINRLLGVTCEATGDAPLTKLVPRLKPEEARRVAAELEKIDSAGIPWDEVLRNEKRVARYELGKQVLHPVTLMTAGWWGVWRTWQKAEMRHKKIAAHVRLLIAELALRCYQSEQGRAPASLDQLVPSYLQHVPIDPFRNSPLIYRLKGTNWLLYSVGEDGVDDGGKPVSRSAPGTVSKGDLFYDDSPF
jgi:hypothetical protein